MSLLYGMAVLSWTLLLKKKGQVYCIHQQIKLRLLTNLQARINGKAKVSPQGHIQYHKQYRLLGGDEVFSNVLVLHYADAEEVARVASEVLKKNVTPGEALRYGYDILGVLPMPDKSFGKQVDNGPDINYADVATVARLKNQVENGFDKADPYY